MMHVHIFRTTLPMSVVVALRLLCLAAACAAIQMNRGGVPYAISNPSGTGTYETEFTDEYFEVYGEIQTRYSQVYWTRNPPYALPDEIIARFNGSVMAITGYEIDQVIRTPQGDVSVPIYNAYNHHYFAWLVGTDAEVYDLDETKYLPHPTRTGVRDKPHLHDYPTNIVFKENPGGEFRKSYHGYPKGFAQLIYSPTQWLVEPMQIDTHNRAYNITDQTGYKPSFLPSSITGKYDPNSGLSPLIECPCSDRIDRKEIVTPAIVVSGTCPTLITSLSACEAAVEALGATVVSSSAVSNNSMPTGCIMVPTGQPDQYIAIYNSASSEATCATPEVGPFVMKGPFNNSAVGCSGACLPNDPAYGCTGEFQGQCTYDSPQEAMAGCMKNPLCASVYCSTQYSSKLLCFARDSSDIQTGAIPSDQVWLKHSVNPPVTALLSGTMASLVNLTVALDGVQATITMTGPNGAWFGVGFDAVQMADAPYAIIVDGTGAVTERRLVSHGPGTQLASSISVVSNQVANGWRTVVMTRAVVGATSDHYTFPSAPTTVNLIDAIGNTPQLAYHKSRTGAKISLLPTKASSCLCQPTTTDYLVYMNTTYQQYSVYCEPEPRSDMTNPVNPACAMQTYMGGLHCCYHQWFLTDRDQESMIPPDVDTYYIKFRYYFQDYTPATPTTPASHQHLHHWVFLIDADVNDYTEVQGSVGKITAHITGAQMGLEDTPASYSGITPLVMTPHCHAPSCIGQTLINADTGEVICNVTAMYGQGTGVFDEKDYVAIPPCLWGYEDGLNKPITLNASTNLYAIKYYNTTFQHLGQMAQWTGLMIYQP